MFLFNQKYFHHYYYAHYSYIVLINLIDNLVYVKYFIFFLECKISNLLFVILPLSLKFNSLMLEYFQLEMNVIIINYSLYQIFIIIINHLVKIHSANLIIFLL